MLTRSYTTLDRLCHIVFDNADFLVEDFTTELKEIMRVYGRLLVSQPGRVAPRQAVIMTSSWTLGVASLVRAYLGNPLIIMNDKVEAAIYSGVKQAVELCSASKRLSNLLGEIEIKWFMVLLFVPTVSRRVILTFSCLFVFRISRKC